MHVHGIFGDLIGKIIGLAMTVARLEAATGAPDGVADPEVIAPVATPVFNVALDKNRASKLADPEHDGIVEQATLLEIFDQSGSRLIGIAALIF